MKSLQSIKEKGTNLEEQLISLQSLIAEIESKCQQQDVELLKDLKNTSARHIEFETFRENKETGAKEEEVDLQIKILESLADLAESHSSSSGNTSKQSLASGSPVMSESMDAFADNFGTLDLNQSSEEANGNIHESISEPCLGEVVTKSKRPRRDICLPKKFDDFLMV